MCSSVAVEGWCGLEVVAAALLVPFCALESVCEIRL